MDVLADIGENPALELTAVLLLMAIWGGCSLTLSMTMTAGAKLYTGGPKKARHWHAKSAPVTIKRDRLAVTN